MRTRSTGRRRAWRRSWFGLLILVGCCDVGLAPARDLPLPARRADAEPGGRLVARVATMPLPERERVFADAVLSGNVPGWLRTFETVRVPPPATRADDTNVLLLSVVADYLAVGSDEDWLWVPLSPGTAQQIADRMGCLLPTRRIVDIIYRAAAVQLDPRPLPPDPGMTTVEYFQRHTELVREQGVHGTNAARRGLVAGHKKDVVISKRLMDANASGPSSSNLAATNRPGRVAIYGWHRTNGVPIQPLYVGHAETWVDYSHGVRLVAQAVLLNGQTNDLATLLRDPVWSEWLSDEGVLPETRYPATRGERSARAAAAGFPANTADESWRRVELAPQVRTLVSEPAGWNSGRPVRLVLYALPNGSTIEQTIGRRARPGDDWKFDIQHIGAQTRWLRTMAPGTEWIVAYLEAEGLAWPAWRRRMTNSSARIVAVVDALARRYEAQSPRLVLSGHSGGGSFIFGYLNGLTQIPARVERIAFLDANYAYDPAAGHAEKFGQWLAEGPDRFLTVLAYHDAVALLDGKPFVSAAGGTWGRSHQMLADLGARFPFVVSATNELARHVALGGRVQFWLRENPERKIWHTIQVERNGFIHALLAGTPAEEREYRYLGERAYIVGD